MKGPFPILALATLVLAPGCRPKKEQVAAIPVLSAPPEGNPHGEAMPGTAMHGAAMPAGAAHGPSMPGGATHGTDPSAPAKKESAVVITEAQKAKWNAIKLGVTEVATKKESVQIVKIGSALTLPGTGLTIKANNLISDFGMGGGVITSRSDTMANPAAQVEILEDGKGAWKGWLFSRFPDTHAFYHEKYTIKLLDFVPAK